MRILHLGKYYWPTYGGMEIAVQDLAETAVELGHSVTCVVANGSAGPGNAEMVAGVAVRRLRNFGKIFSTPIAPGYAFLPLADFHLVHIHLPHPLAELRVLFQLLTKKTFSEKLIPYFHAMPVNQGWLGRIWFNTITTFILNRCSRVMLSNSNFFEAFPQLKRWQHKTTVVPFCLSRTVTDERFSPKLNITAALRLGAGVLALGRLVPYKGYDILIEAWARLARSRTKIPSLWIAGSGPEREKLETLARDRGILGQIRFLGDVNEAEKRLLFRSALFFAAPSVTSAETFGISILEAMGYGLAVVATDLPTGVRELARNGKCGALADPGDAVSLERALAILLDDLFLRENSGKENREFVEKKYSRAGLRKAYADLLQSSPLPSLFHDSRERYLVICPEYPPSLSGLAGYTRCFSEELAKTADVTVLTSKSPATTASNLKINSVEILPIVERWSIFHLYRYAKIIADHNPDRIVLQYLPFLYSPRAGINFSICFFALLLRLRGLKVDLICHELHYPAQPNPKAMLMFSCHIAMLNILASASDRIYISTYFFYKRAKKILFWRGNIFHLPVGSNMPFLRADTNALEKFQAKHQLGNSFVILQFGTLHPTRNLELVCRLACDWAEENRVPVKLLYIGESPETVLATLSPRTRARMQSRLIALGKVNEAQFSLAVHASHACISYFSDGATTRRGSLLGVLLYSLPTIASQTAATESVFTELDNLYLVNADTEAFAIGAKSALSKIYKAKEKMSPKISSAFLSKFGWDKIIARFRNPISP